ncbi:hypothetical protein FNF27_07808 [Cafeteria roenbergensis]|uniref:Fibronectin type III-like domain-containing protein n=1 Tax=Cafeteria roenbergensis TaxID=33653 RepID=A0A5A8DFU3_CAFRO|nr:hypothetical protein FNF27_07808 [Cafeteria roenbergensis]
MRPLSRALLAAAAAAAGAAVALADHTPNNNAFTNRTCGPGFQSLPFCNASASVAFRAADLVGRLHSEDKGPLLTARGSPRGNLASAPYIGLNVFDWGENALHGDQTLCVSDPEHGGVGRCSTSFPMPNAAGSSFNRSAVRAMGYIIGLEARAQWRVSDTEASVWSGRPPIGPQTWSPTINEPRDPRWGRYQEVPSASPLWLGEYAREYVAGAQYGLGPDSLARAAGLAPGDANGTLLTVTCVKHLVAYSLEGRPGSSVSRHNFDALVAPFDMADTYLKAFHAALGGDLPALGVMCSYNAVNGAPTCAGGGGGVVREYLRERWGSQAYMTSDTGAITDIYDAHHMEPTPEAAVCAALVNGSTDMNSGDVFWHHVESAVSQGLCGWGDVDAALRRTLGLRIRLGLMDDPASTPYWNVPLSVIGSDAHVAVARQASRDALVLLKNDGKVLPFRRGGVVAVIGPHSQAREAQLGSYLGQICSNPDSNANDFSCVMSPQEAVAAANTGGSVIQATGCSVDGDSTSGIAEAVAAAKQADSVILMVGSDQSVEGESHDRISIDLPGVQHQLIAAVAAVGKPTAVVIMRGGPVDVDPERRNKAVGAMIDAGFPGQYGAEAIASAVFGDFSPGGRLATHFYHADYVNGINMTDMRMAFGPQPRGDRYFPADQTVFPFGAGLSYSTFELQWTPASAVGPGRSPALPTGSGEGATTAHAEVKVSNTGSVRADVVLLARFRVKSLPQGSPLTRLATALRGQLFDFARLTLDAGESTTASFDVSAAALELVDPATGDTVISPGTFLIEISEFSSQLQGEVDLVGQTVVVDKFPAQAAAAYRQAASSQAE